MTYPKGPAARLIDKSPKMERVEMPDVNEPEEKRINYNTKTSKGIYRLLMLIFDPSVPGGQGVLKFNLPNIKEYRRCMRQIRRKCKLIKYINVHDEPEYIQIGPNVLNVAVEKLEATKVLVDKEGKTKEGIVLPSSDLISKLH